MHFSAFLFPVGRVGGVLVINFKTSRDYHHAASLSREVPVADKTIINIKKN